MWSMKLLDESGVVDRLSIFGAEYLTGTVECLVSDQDERLAAGDQVSRIPLLWRGLAETVGLVVDDHGRIVGGPHVPVPGL